MNIIYLLANITLLFMADPIHENISGLLHHHPYYLLAYLACGLILLGLFRKALKKGIPSYLYISLACFVLTLLIPYSDVSALNSQIHLACIYLAMITFALGLKHLLMYSYTKCIAIVLLSLASLFYIGSVNTLSEIILTLGLYFFIL